MKKDNIDLNEFLDLTIEEIFADRFGRYSKYIIQDRALPDVRDGLKPVQRRVVYSMNKEGNTFSKQFRKSAKTVGNVIGNYHPHGDTSVYDAMVRMSQDWKVNQPLIIMHGNNGSIDGDSAAAMRYTEAKMSQYAELMVVDIDEETVNKIPNFDDTELEPTVLPTRIPNLLINGSSGISAGYATDIPPHNPVEVIKASIYLNDNPDATLEDIMKIMPGPDLPTGAIIQGLNGIKEAYETGRGKIVIKSEVKIEKNNIIVTAIPYEVNKSTLLQKIDLIRINKKIDGIKEVVDHSDQHGIEIMVTCQKDANVQMILNYLLKNTDLQKNYSFNMIAINNKRPEQMGVLKILQAFLNHRKEVVLRRSQYRLKKAQAKLHVLEGMILAVSNLDQVVEIIRASKDKSDSKQNLIKTFKFSDEQAEAVVMMQLYRLSNTDITNLRETVEELNGEVNILNKILSNKDVLNKLITSELNEVLEQVKAERKTTLGEEIEEIVINQSDLIKLEKNIVSITKSGYIKRANIRSYVASHELSSCQPGDVVVNNILTTTRSQVLVFFSDGTYVIIPVHEIEETKWKDTGKHISSIAKINDGVSVIGIVSTNNFEDTSDIFSLSKLGYYTRMNFEDLKSTKLKNKIQWVKTKKDDEIISVDFVKKGQMSQILFDDVMFITNLGRYVKFKREDLEVFNVKRTGLKLINLRKGEEFEFVKYLDSDIGLFTDLGGYFAIDGSLLDYCDKPNILYTNTKSNPHTVMNCLKLNTSNILMKTQEQETMVTNKQIKRCIAEGKFKNLQKEDDIISYENLIEVN